MQTLIIDKHLFFMNDSNNWYVLHTKPRNEKKVAANLQKLGVEVYCPTRIEWHQWSDRKKKVEVPLLPSLVLVKTQEKFRNMVFDVPGILRYMTWLGKPAIVPEAEVEMLKRVANGTYGYNMELETVEPGKVVSLGFLGLEGQKGMVKYVSNNQCWVLLEHLGYVIKLNLEH